MGYFSDTVIMKLIDLLYDCGVVDFILRGVQRVDEPQHFQVPSFLAVNMEGRVDLRVYARHFIPRYDLVQEL